MDLAFLLFQMVEYIKEYIANGMIIEKLKGMVKSDNPNATVTTQSFCKYT